MRVLATLALSFSAAVFACVFLPWTDWQLWGALVALLLAVLVLLLRAPLGRKHPLLPKRLGLILCAAAVGLGYFWGYHELVRQAVEDRCGQVESFSGVVCSLPEERERGGRVTLRLDGGRGAKVVYYGDESVLSLQPGQRVSGTAYWQDAGRIRDNEITTFTSRGVYALLFSRDTAAVSEGESGTWRAWPLRSARAVRDVTERIWDDPATAGFTVAELTGDKTHLSKSDISALSEVGLAHLFAVSGLHCAFLVGLLGLLIPPRRRRLFAVAAAAVLLFYMMMVGMTPSVVRACVMQLFLLAAPIFRRDSDGLTALSAALLLLLLINPYAAASVSLQLSFAATAGLVCLSGRLYRAFTGWYHGERRALRWLIAFVGGNLAATLGALVFTVPLTAIYFDTITLIAPLSNLLAVSAAGWNFMAGMVSVALGLIWLPAARITGWLCFACVHYIFLVRDLLARLPWHTLYLTNPLLKYWLGYCYALFLGCAATGDRRRKYVLATVLAAAMLVVVVEGNAAQYRYGEMCAVAVDVGQGESVLLHSGGETALVDCGSSNTYVDAARQVTAQMSAMNVRRIDDLVVTHYHADHTNGLYDLLRRGVVKRMYVPRIEDEYGVKEKLITLAESKGVEVYFVDELTELALGEARLRIYPPVGQGDLNEQGLTALCSAEDFDLLVTGDMAGSTEEALIDAYDLPDIEVLLVSHHGSRYSSHTAFLQAMRPEAAIISVGDNSYGHPDESAMARLRAAGAAVYRTDEGGNILVTVGKAD